MGIMGIDPLIDIKHSFPPYISSSPFPLLPKTKLIWNYVQSLQVNDNNWLWFWIPVAHLGWFSAAMIIMLIFAQCCRLQWPAHYLGGQCLYPACAEPEPGHKELQVLAPRPSPQPVSAASQPAWSPEQPSQASERETGDSEDWGAGSGPRASQQSQQLPAWDGQTAARPARIRPSQPSELLSAQLATGQ